MPEKQNLEHLGANATTSTVNGVLNNGWFIIEYVSKIQLKQIGAATWILALCCQRL